MKKGKKSSESGEALPAGKDIEQTLVLIKPDGLKRSLTGNIMSMISAPDLIIAGAKVVQVTRELAEEHYQHLREKAFFNELIKYIMGEWHTKRVLALVYEGVNAIQMIREKAGAPNPEEAHPESIRGKYGRIHSKTGIFENVIHCSENRKEAEREIKLWFRPSELIHTIYPAEMKKESVDILFWK